MNASTWGRTWHRWYQHRVSEITVTQPVHNHKVKVHETDVLIIGGGVTGSGVMRDLALRGINCLLIDRTDLNAGASGGNHGLLHSGGRY